FQAGRKAPGRRPEGASPMKRKDTSAMGKKALGDGGGSRPIAAKASEGRSAHASEESDFHDF
ncbi:MAG: hypothetical protein AABZ13_08585, partial [Planctomycetota bacterium]